MCWFIRASNLVLPDETWYGLFGGMATGEIKQTMSRDYLFVWGVDLYPPDPKAIVRLMTFDEITEWFRNWDQTEGGTYDPDPFYKDVIEYIKDCMGDEIVLAKRRSKPC